MSDSHRTGAKMKSPLSRKHEKNSSRATIVGLRRRGAVKALLTVVLLCASAGAGAQDVRVVETRNLRVSAPAHASHLLQLNVYTFSGTRWKTDDVLKATAAAARLLEVCGVAVTSVELRVLDAPAEFRVFSTSVSRALMRELAAPRPALFFVDDTRSRPAFDAETIGRGNSRSRPELADTIWVAHGARDLPLALAHELVHLLSDSGEHSEEPGNLMREETAPKNVKLNEAQCDRLRSRGETNGLLERR